MDNDHLGGRKRQLNLIYFVDAAKVTQADIARVIRAVAQARVKAVVEVAPDGTIRVLIGEDAQSDALRHRLLPEREDEIIL